jgi:hypothetical protein
MPADADEQTIWFKSGALNVFPTQLEKIWKRSFSTIVRMASLQAFILCPGASSPSVAADLTFYVSAT